MPSLTSVGSGETTGLIGSDGVGILIALKKRNIEAMKSEPEKRNRPNRDANRQDVETARRAAVWCSFFRQGSSAWRNLRKIFKYNIELHLQRSALVSASKGLETREGNQRVRIGGFRVQSVFWSRDCGMRIRQGDGKRDARI